MCIGEYFLPKKIGSLLKWQFILGLFFVIVYSLIAGISTFFAAFYGVSISILGNGLLAYFVFKHEGATAAKSILKGLYFGELVKFCLTILMFLLAIIFWHFDFKPLIFSYIFAQMSWYFSVLFS